MYLDVLMDDPKIGNALYNFVHFPSLIIDHYLLNFIMISCVLGYLSIYWEDRQYNYKRMISPEYSEEDNDLENGNNKSEENDSNFNEANSSGEGLISRKSDSSPLAVKRGIRRPNKLKLNYTFNKMNMTSPALRGIPSIISATGRSLVDAVRTPLG